jgi:hypothetical protein
MQRAIAFTFALTIFPAFSQPPQAILVDGAGPWRTSTWSFAVTELAKVLTDAGYSLNMVSPVDLPSALSSTGGLVVVPSLETLPLDSFKAITSLLARGGSLMASGGEPFRAPLYLSDGQWLDTATYQRMLGSAPPQGSFQPPIVETLSPSYKQYSNGVGLRVPIGRGRGLFGGT